MGAMTARVKGKWAQGIQPRSFSWVMKDLFAICERPGGYGENHRRVRRMEEIIWLREQGFGKVISIIPSAHNLHNYDELGMPYLHRPFGMVEDPARYMSQLFPEIRSMLASRTKIVLHNEFIDDRIGGLLGGYLRWTGMVSEIPLATTLVERITNRQLETFGRELVTIAGDLPR
jgi:hypothetical protein